MERERARGETRDRHGVAATNEIILYFSWQPSKNKLVLQAAVLFAQLNQVKQNVASLRDMIESRGTGQVQ